MFRVMAVCIETKSAPETRFGSQLLLRGVFDQGDNLPMDRFALAENLGEG